MKIDDNVPKMTPKLMAKAKLRMLAPPMKKMQSNTSKVVPPVLMVRVSVSFIERLNSW